MHSRYFIGTVDHHSESRRNGGPSFRRGSLLQLLREYLLDTLLREFVAGVAVNQWRILLDIIAPISMRPAIAFAWRLGV